MVGQFWGREKELSLMKSLYNGPGSVFLRIYGRRRIGKTQLVQRFLSEIQGKSLYYYVDLAEDAVLLKTMADAIFQQLNEKVVLRTWDDLFAYIAELARERFVLAIDEAPRFLDSRSIFLTRLQLAWDTIPGLKNTKLMILIIGSSIGMMEKIIGRNGPLYGRVTHTIKLKPLDYYEFRQAFPELQEHDRILHYAAFGGTPHYVLAARNERGTVMDKIEKLMVTPQAALSYEAEQLFVAESIREPARYVSILRAIASGKVELNEIQAETGIQKEQLPVYLKRLDKLLDIVRSADPIGGKKKNARYTVSDNFFNFWFRFIFPNRSSIEIGNTRDALEKIGSQLKMHAGGTFEQIASELLTLYQNRDIDGTHILFDRIGKWWNRKGDEIDIVATHFKTGTVYIADVLYSMEEYKPVDLEILQMRIKLLGFPGVYRLILISRSGFSEQVVAEAQRTGIALVDLKKLSELFDAA
ncbi:ATP-binding protein [Candidatus Woesearchaeota archaeon]|nr:ATP-binding protein [Candidatus Woesearchaeota archaeon]